MPNTPRRIEVLAFDNTQLLDVAGPLQVFATANDLAVPAGNAPPYQPEVVAREPMPRSSSGLVLAAGPLPQPDTPVDTLIIAGGRGIAAACTDPDLVAWVTAREKVARRTASVCSGAYLLARAGLLDGRRATTHWDRFADFAARFPRVRLETDPIFIEDGNIWTSAGVTAGIDLALAMVEADLGRAPALAVARQLVVFMKRPGGQAQFSTMLRLQDGDGRFDRLHGWIAENLHRDLSLETLATHANMSVRSFARHYRQATGLSPARAVGELRLETARRLLEEGVSVSRIARRCGFGSEETLRRRFVQRYGTSPQGYRERFAV